MARSARTDAWSPTETADPWNSVRSNGWSGSCAGTLGCAVTLDQARSVNASFVGGPVTLGVDVPTGGSSALLTFSRPYFRGYEARIGDQKLAVTSYHGLFPIVGLPAGTPVAVAVWAAPS